MSLESHALHCSECSVPVGSDGPQRAALLLPCEHVTHVSCAEFVARKVKYFKRLTSPDTVVVPDGAQEEAGLSSSTFFCPGCGEEVERIVPLYLANEQGHAEDATVSEQFARAYQAQRQCLRSLRHLWERKSKVVALGHRCAALHAQRAAHLREVQQYQLIFSPLATSDAAEAQSAAARIASRIEEMSVSELELYLSQSTPALLNSQAALRRERRQLEQRKKKLNALKAQYHTRKELARVQRQIDEAQGTGGKHALENATASHSAASLEPSPGGRQGSRTTPHLHARSLRAMDAFISSAEEPMQAHAAPSRPGEKRRRERGVVNVDELTFAHQRSSALEVHCVDDWDVSGTDAASGIAGTTARGCARRSPVTPAAASGPPQQSEPEVIDVDDEDDGDDTHPEPSWPSSSASDGLTCSYRGSMRPGGEVDDATADALPVFLSSIVPKSAHQVAPHSNHVRLLPRREDRLWQPSLQF